MSPETGLINGAHQEAGLSQTEVFLEGHPSVAKLMSMTSFDFGTPWLFKSGDEFIPVAYLAKLFKSNNSKSGQGTVYQTVSYQLRKWIGERPEGDPTVDFGPKLKVLPRGEVLDFLIFTDTNLRLKGSKCHISADTELPSLQRAINKREQYQRRSYLRSERTRTDRPDQQIVSSMSFSDAWLGTPRPGDPKRLVITHSEEPVKTTWKRKGKHKK